MVVDEDELIQALSDIDKARVLEAGIAVERGTTDFATSECHGDSNLTKGYAYHDAVQGKCTNGDSMQWCRDRKLHITYKATFTQHQEGPCRVLVRSWTHKMQWLYDYELAHGGADFSFSPAVLALYQEPDELTRLFSTAKKAETKKRILAIRSIPK